MTPKEKAQQNLPTGLNNEAEELFEALSAAIAYIDEHEIEDHPDPGALIDCFNTAHEVYHKYKKYK
jgi:hypothetical protein